MAKFKVGDKLCHKIALIVLTFEVVAVKDYEYVLKSNKGEEFSAYYIHVHEFLELVE